MSSDGTAAAEPALVRAAGGVVWRPSASRTGTTGERKPVEVLLVHRPRYDDWSIAKGKLDADETDEECALREVEEETGLRCELGVELAGSRYVDNRGRPKQVRYWAMRVVDGRFTPGDEVDAVRWLPLDEACAVVTYPRDQQVLASFRAACA